MGELFPGAPLVCYQDVIEGLRVYVFRCLGDDTPSSVRECVLTDQHMMSLGVPSFPGKWQSLASFLASLRVAGVEVGEAWAVPGLGMRPNGISGQAVAGGPTAGGLQSGMSPDLGLTDHELGHLLLFDRDDGGPLAPVDINVIQQAGFESFSLMRPEGTAIPTGFTGLKVGQEVLPETDPALWKEDEWMNTLIQKQMIQEDEPELESDSDSGEESEEEEEEENLKTAKGEAGKTLPTGVGFYVAQEMANVTLLQNFKKEKERKPQSNFGGQVENVFQFFQSLEPGTLEEAMTLETAGKVTVSDLCAMAGLDGEQLEQIEDRSRPDAEDKQDG